MIFVDVQTMFVWIKRVLLQQHGVEDSEQFTAAGKGPNQGWLLCVT
jgi:hypothetical protein